MKMNIVKLVNLCLVASCLLLCLNECHAQLTFTPSWGGKRSQPQTAPIMFADAASNVPQSMGCNPKMDSMLLIYRLIQNEAQKMFDCNSQTK